MPKRTAILLCIDGCSPDYIRKSDMPFLRRIGEEGFSSIGASMIPSVTNVNNVSIITGKYPAEHGITSNYYYDRATGVETYMECPDFIKAKNMLELGFEKGLRTALLTSKDKLRTLLNLGASITFSSERPPPWIVEKIGPPPPIYSIEVDLWLLKALREIMVAEKPDLVYVSTTDYAMHKHHPSDAESRSHMKGIDEALEATVRELENGGEDVLICVTADHGMNDKRRVIDLESVLGEHGVLSKMNPIIKDRYVAHHSNLGGSAYLYLKDISETQKTIDVLSDIEGVEAVLVAEEACKAYHLDAARVGDFLVLGERDYAFGLTGEEVLDISVRTHGSLHEAQIPVIMSKPIRSLDEPVEENKDLAQHLLRWVTAV